MGALTPLGQAVGEYWDGLTHGKSGIGPMTLCDPSLFPSKIAGEVTGFDPGQYINPKEARRMARFSQLAVAAASLAVEHGGLDLSKEDPVFYGRAQTSGISQAGPLPSSFVATLLRMTLGDG